MNKQEAWGWIIGGAISGAIITLINAINARKQRKRDEEIKAKIEKDAANLVEAFQQDMLRGFRKEFSDVQSEES